MSIYFFDHLYFLFGMPGGTELVLILLVILLFFGGKKIPGLMRGLGRSVKEFNDARAGKKEGDDQPAKQNQGNTSQK